MGSKYKILIIILFLASVTIKSEAAITSAVQVTQYNNPAPGYFLFGPADVNGIGLLDNCGKVVHQTTAEHTKFASNLQMRNNYLTFFYRNIMGSFVGYLAVDQNYNPVDSFTISNDMQLDDHDFEWLPDGSYYVFGLFGQRVDMSKLVPNGNENASVRGFIIQKKNRFDQIVFSWNSFDHYNVLDGTSDVDMTANVINPFHINAIQVDVDGNLIISCRHMDEITKIDVNTGDIIWRLGGSLCRNNQFRFVNDTVGGFFGFSHQHDIQLLPNGHFLIFDNGNLKSPQYSRAVEYSIDEVNKTVTKVWEYKHNPSIYSTSQGSVQRLPNGNTVINWSGNDNNYVLTEVTSSGQTTIEMQGTMNDINYRIYKHMFKLPYNQRTINAKGNYSFNTNNDSNDIKLDYNIDTLTGTGTIGFERHTYAPHNVSFNGSAPLDVFPARWVLKNTGITKFSGIISFDVPDIGTFANPQDLRVYYRAREGTSTFSIITSNYNTNLRKLEFRARATGEYIIGLINLSPPKQLLPADSAKDVKTNAMFSWEAVSGAVSYRFQISTSPTFGTVLFDTNNVVTTSVSSNKLQETTNYYWRVRANFSASSSGWSSVRRFTTYLTPPKLISPNDSSYKINSDGSLSWSDNPKASKYYIQVSDNLSFTNLIVNDSSIAETFKYSKFLNNATYFWRVKSVSNITVSDWSNYWIFTTHLDSANLISPSNGGKNLALTQLEFKWNKVDGATTYRIELSEDKEFMSVFDSDILAFDTVYVTDAPLKPLSNYYWRIIASSNLNTGYWSEANRFYTRLRTPELLLPYDKQQNAKIDLPFTWDISSGADKYKFQLADDKGFSNFYLDTIITNSNEVFLKKLPYDRTFFWRVSALNDTSFSDWSGIREVTTQQEFFVDIPVLSYPHNSEYNLPKKIVLKWETVPSATKYNFELAIDSSFTNMIYSYSGLTTTSTTELDFSYNSTYYWRVKAVAPQNISDWSKVFSFNTRLKNPILSQPANQQTNVSLMPTFNWTMVPGANNYNLLVSKNQQFSDVSDFNSDKISFTPENPFELNTKYYWKVKGVGGMKESDFSEVFEFTTSDVNQVENNERFEHFSFSPNPFSDVLNISLDLPGIADYSVELYSLQGEKLAELICVSGSTNKLRTDFLESGIYIIKIKYSDITKTLIGVHIK